MKRDFSSGDHTAQRQSTKALPEHARVHNRSLVMRSLFHRGQLSRADLARITGLTPVTISAVVTELIADGIVADTGEHRISGKVGKPAKLVQLQAESHSIVAIDLSTDGQMHGGILNLAGELIEECNESIQVHGDRGIEAVTELSRSLIVSSPSPVLGVGIASPGVVDPTGRVIESVNCGWFDVPLAEQLSESLNITTHVANDAHCVALSELTFGAGDERSFLAMTLGRGVGAGIVINGALVYGASGAAGEVGHVTVTTPEDEWAPSARCACGRWGCLETILGQTALKTSLDQLPQAEHGSHLTRLAQRTSRVLSPVVAALNLSEVVLCGPSETYGDVFLNSLERSIRSETFAATHRKLVVRMSRIPHHGAILGAAVLVLSGSLGVH